MGTSPRKHTIPLAGETPRRQALVDGFASVNDITPVANVTARAQLVADLRAAGQGPTATRPLYVWRGDAETGSEVEVTTDGTSWRRLNGGPTSVATARFSDGSVTDFAAGAVASTLVLGMTTAVPSAGRWLITGGYTWIPAGNCAGEGQMISGGETISRVVHSQSTTAPQSVSFSMARTYTAGVSADVALRHSQSPGSTASKVLGKWISLTRLF